MAVEPEERRERRALGWLSLGAALIIVWLARPFATGVLFGALMAFTVEPIYRKLALRTNRPFLSSIAVVLASGLVIVGSAAGFVSLFVTKVIDLVDAVQTELGPGGRIPGWADTISGWLSRAGISKEAVTERLRETAESIGARFAGSAGHVVTGTFLALLGFFFALLTMHAVLVGWKRMVSGAESLSPLRADHTRELLEEFRKVGRTTLLGTLLTGVAQGILAGIGYWVTGVPQPLFLGIATAIASVVPAVGTLLVWVPAGIYLYSIGSPVAAFLELVWGAIVVVGISDYVIRPRLVGDEAVPALLTFLALFGGLEVMGLSGLIVGPVLMALAVAVLRLQGLQGTSE